MNKENCALKLVDEIILYYDARSKKLQITDSIIYLTFNCTESVPTICDLLDTPCLDCYEQAGCVFRLMKGYLLYGNCKIILSLVLS